MNTMETDADLPTLIARQDHLNVLRYIRVHELRQPETVVHHGLLLLGGEKLNKKLGDNLARLAALEQICYAALDLQQGGDSAEDQKYTALAKTCLDRLREASVEKESVRFRLLLARCLEAAHDYAGAQLIYQDLLQDNPANLMAMKRLYCIAKSQAVDMTGREEACQALHDYLQLNYADTAAWYELAQLRMEMGDFPRAIFCYQEVLLAVPADAALHVALAECYSTLAATATSSTSTSATTASTSSLSDLEYCTLARKHMAQALELDPTNRRALLGLVVTSNDYLLVASQVSVKSKKQLAAAAAAAAAADEDDDDSPNAANTQDHEQLVAKELIHYGAEHLLTSYQGTQMSAAVQRLLNEYTE